jgi:hypothetical protein
VVKDTTKEVPTQGVGAAVGVAGRPVRVTVAWLMSALRESKLIVTSSPSDTKVYVPPGESFAIRKVWPYSLSPFPAFSTTVT